MRYLLANAGSSPRLYIVRGFLTTELCQRLLLEIQGCTSRPATVYADKGLTAIDPSHRRTSEAVVPADLQSAVEAAFAHVRPRLEQHFGVTLRAFENIQFLRYQRGDFFRLHQDSSDDTRFGPAVRYRKVSTVLFLNRQTRLPEKQAYCGGGLCLFRVDADPDPCLSVGGDTGLLVAFPSDVIHEVRPVTHGERFTVVTWYVDRNL